MKTRRPDFKKLAVLAARAADDKKAHHVEVFDIRLESDIADYVLLAEVDSSVQMRAVESAIEEALEDLGARALRRDGRLQNKWMAIDFGGFIAHVMTREGREYYRLEHLWEKPKKVAW